MAIHFLPNQWKQTYEKKKYTHKTSQKSSFLLYDLSITIVFLRHPILLLQEYLPNFWFSFSLVVYPKQ